MNSIQGGVGVVNEFKCNKPLAIFSNARSDPSYRA
jgi:hypothetical protein